MQFYLYYLNIYFDLMSDSGSERSQPIKVKPHKIFVTGMNGSSDLKQLETDLRKIFQKYGDLQSVVPKKSHNGAYCYAFIDFKQGEDATVAVEKENNCYIGDKKVTIELQDSSRKKKGAGEGCYECGKAGHFARQCRNKPSKSRRGGRRSRSRSTSHHKRKRRRQSYSSDSSSRSRSFRKESKGKLKVNNRKEKTFEITERQTFQEQETQEGPRTQKKKKLFFRLNDPVMNQILQINQLLINITSRYNSIVLFYLCQCLALTTQI